MYNTHPFFKRSHNGQNCAYYSEDFYGVPKASLPEEMEEGEQDGTS